MSYINSQQLFGDTPALCILAPIEVGLVLNPSPIKQLLHVPMAGTHSQRDYLEPDPSATESIDGRGSKFLREIVRIGGYITTRGNLY